MALNHDVLHVPAVQQRDHLFYKSLWRLAFGSKTGCAVLLNSGDGGQLRAFENTHALLRDIEMERELEPLVRHDTSRRSLTDLLSHLLELRQVSEHVLHVVQTCCSLSMHQLAESFAC